MKLKGFVKTHGTPQVLYAVVANRLDLQESTLPKVALKSHDGMYVHAFFVLPDGGMIFGFKDTKTAYTYRVDPILNLIASVAMTDSIASEISKPEDELQKQFAYWVHIADELDDSGNPKSNPTAPATK